MIFEEVEWTDDGDGHSLQNSLFLKKLEKTAKRTIKKKSRKRKKVANEESMSISNDAEEDKCSPCKQIKQCDVIGKGNDEDVALAKTMHMNEALVQSKSSPKTYWKRKRLEKMMSKSSESSKIITKQKSEHENSPIEVKEERTISAELRTAMSSKLQSAQFRFLNEQLYTRDSQGAKDLFINDPRSFVAYHSGFLQQVSKWPINPLDLIIAFVKKRPQHWVVGDFGCGDARLSASVKNKVHSFDLVAINERVTVADIRNVPLPDASLNVAVFCLSLMGTNYIDFLVEANRTLMDKGLLFVAEVTSRFQNVPKFLTLMKKLGFKLKRQHHCNSLFLLFDFIKVKPPQTDFQKPSGLLKPCVYKKR